MGLNLGDRVPDFIAETSNGMLHFYDYISNKWAILFSHPDDFTPVCTTEFVAIAKNLSEFENRGVKILALSCNSVQNHKGWISDIEFYMPGVQITYPIITDTNRELAVRFGMLDPTQRNMEGEPVTARGVFVIGPDKRLKLFFLYPVTTGPNVEEIIRVVDSLQLTAKFDVATPADWKAGDKCMIDPCLSKEKAFSTFSKGFETIPLPSGKDYLRLTPHPIEASVKRSMNQFVSVFKACNLGSLFLGF